MSSVPQYRSRRAARFALSAASILVSLLAFEIYVRATWQGQWQIPKDAVRSPGIFSLRMKPDHESDLTTMDGHRFHVKTRRPGIPRPIGANACGEPRDHFLGDSFTFGWEVELNEQGL